MDDENRRLLDQYIGRILELKDAKKWSFSEEELKEIALGIGLTEADLALARRETAAHIQRGATYADSGDWDGAARQYEGAAALDPLGAPTQLALAEFYFARWQKTKKGKRDLDKAIDDCLLLAPDSAPAGQLLLQARRLHRRRRFWRGLKWAALIVVAPFIFLAGAAFLKEAGFITPSPSGFEGTAYSVPAEIVPIEAGEGIETVLETVRIVHDESVYRQTSFDWEYAGRIASDRYEVQKLRYTVDFLDTQGATLASSYLWLFNADSGYAGDYDTFTLHPGDRLLFAGTDGTYLEGDDPRRIARVRLRPTLVERARPPAAYPEYPLVALEWRSRPMDYLAFAVRERQNAFYNDDYGRPRHYLQLEITHRGERPCRELTLLIEWVDAEGQVVRDLDTRVITLAHRPVEPGTRLILSHTEYFDEDVEGQPFAAWRVSVKTAD